MKIIDSRSLIEGFLGLRVFFGGMFRVLGSMKVMILKPKEHQLIVRISVNFWSIKLVVMEIIIRFILLGFKA